MITADGWLDWGERLRGPVTKTNPGINPVKGVFLHSAEGYADTLLNLAVNGPLSWHASNLMDGRFIQHYPFTDRCWHATAANNNYIGVENEGVFTREASLNEAQTANAVRLIADLAAWKGWTPTRTGDKTQTLWEHREVTWLGGSATACPSGRIPWDVILKALEGDMDGWQKKGKQYVLVNEGIEVLKIGDEAGEFPGRIAKNFGGTFQWLRRTILQSEGSSAAVAMWSEEEGD